MRYLPTNVKEIWQCETLGFIIRIYSGQTVISFSELIAHFFIYIVINDSNYNTCRSRLFPGFLSKSLKCLALLSLYIEACTDPVFERYCRLVPFSSSSNTYIYSPNVAVPFKFVMFKNFFDIYSLYITLWSCITAAIFQD